MDKYKEMHEYLLVDAMRSIAETNRINALLQLSLEDVAEFCENQYLDEGFYLSLEDFLLGKSFTSRSDLCKYLGIRESTLTGWFKRGRIPRMAMEARALLNAFFELRDEVVRLRKERDSESLKLIKDGDKYHLIRMRKDGSAHGEMVAKDISSESEALLLVNAEKSLDSAIGFFSDFGSYHNFLSDRVGLDDFYEDELDRLFTQENRMVAIRAEINSPDKFRAYKKKIAEHTHESVREIKKVRAKLSLRNRKEEIKKPKEDSSNVVSLAKRSKRNTKKKEGK